MVSTAPNTKVQSSAKIVDAPLWKVVSEQLPYFMVDMGFMYQKTGLNCLGMGYMCDSSMHPIIHMMLSGMTFRCRFTQMGLALVSLGRTEEVLMAFLNGWLGSPDWNHTEDFEPLLDAFGLDGIPIETVVLALEMKIARGFEEPDSTYAHLFMDDWREPRAPDVLDRYIGALRPWVKM